LKIEDPIADPIAMIQSPDDLSFIPSTTVGFPYGLLVRFPNVMIVPFSISFLPENMSLLELEQNRY